MPSPRRWLNSSSISNHSCIYGTTTLSINMSTTMITPSSPTHTRTSSAPNLVLASPGLSGRHSSICHGTNVPKDIFCPSTAVPATSTVLINKSSLPSVSPSPHLPTFAFTTDLASISYWESNTWPFATGISSSSTSDQSTSFAVATTTFTSSGSTFITIYRPGTMPISSVSAGPTSMLASNAANEASQPNSGSGSDSAPSYIWIGSVAAIVSAFLILIGIILCTRIPPLRLPSRPPSKLL
jgi:hypothetical protein